MALVKDDALNTGESDEFSSRYRAFQHLRVFRHHRVVVLGGDFDAVREEKGTFYFLVDPSRRIP